MACKGPEAFGDSIILLSEVSLISMNKTFDHITDCSRDII